MRRSAGVRLSAILLAGSVAGGCSSGYGLAHAGPSASPASPASLQNLAGSVHHIMVESGIPLQNGHVGCVPVGDLQKIRCFGETATTPVTKVEGDFSASSATAGPGGCPGTLTVKFGQTLVQSERENPCR